jgi:pilus assembly protein Flp/PilA
MFKIKRTKKESGQGMVEYALILVLVAIVVIAVLMLLGPIIGGVFSTINDSLSGFGAGGGGVAAAPVVPAGYPKTWGNPPDATSDAQACIDTGQSGGGTAYLWTADNPPHNGTAFIWSGSSTPPVSGYYLNRYHTCL